jgi:hypothetical protein
MKSLAIILAAVLIVGSSLMTTAARAQSRPTLRPLEVQLPCDPLHLVPNCKPIAAPTGSVHELSPDDLWKKIQSGHRRRPEIRQGARRRRRIARRQAALRLLCGLDHDDRAIPGRRSEGCKRQSPDAAGPACVLFVRAARRGCRDAAADGPADGRVRSGLDRAQALGSAILHHGGERRRRSVGARHRDSVRQR